jgi:hypothetical protein
LVLEKRECMMVCRSPSDREREISLKMVLIGCLSNLKLSS